MPATMKPTPAKIAMASTVVERERQHDPAVDDPEDARGSAPATTSRLASRSSSPRPAAMPTSHRSSRPPVDRPSRPTPRHRANHDAGASSGATLPARIAPRRAPVGFRPWSTCTGRAARAALAGAGRGVHGLERRRRRRLDRRCATWPRPGRPTSSPSSIPRSSSTTSPPGRRSASSTATTREIVWPATELLSASTAGRRRRAGHRARAAAALAHLLPRDRRGGRGARRLDGGHPGRAARRRAPPPAGVHHRHRLRRRPGRALRPAAVPLRGARRASSAASTTPAPAPASPRCRCGPPSPPTRPARPRPRPRWPCCGGRPRSSAPRSTPAASSAEVGGRTRHEVDEYVERDDDLQSYVARLENLVDEEAEEPDEPAAAAAPAPSTARPSGWWPRWSSSCATRAPTSELARPASLVAAPDGGAGRVPGHLDRFAPDGGEGLRDPTS